MGKWKKKIKKAVNENIPKDLLKTPIIQPIVFPELQEGIPLFEQLSQQKPENFRIENFKNFKTP